MIQKIDFNFLLHATFVPEDNKSMKVVSSNNLSFVDSGLSCDTFNIIHIKNGELITEKELSTTLKYFVEKKLDYCVWVNKENLTNNLKTIFAELGLTQQNEEVGMAMNLSQYVPIHSEKHDHIFQVDDTKKLKDYSNVIAANWTPTDKNVLSYYEAAAAQYLEEENNIILHVYYEDNRPKATLELFPSDAKTIGIYGLATLEDARGRGIGSALMTKALNIAKERNYNQVVLQATEDGIGIYQKLGFVQHTKYYEYA